MLLNQDNTLSRMKLRPNLQAHLPLLVLALGATACGARYELGELAQNIEDPGPPKSVESAAVNLMATLADADAMLAPIPYDASGQKRAGVYSYVGVGDMDGDGNADAAIVHSFSTAPAQQSYAIHLVYGGARPEDGILPVDPLPSLVFSQRNLEAVDLSAAGDINGDGYADALVTTGAYYFQTLSYDDSPRYRYSASTRPQAYLLYGGPERLTVTESTLLSEPGVAFADRDDLGAALAGTDFREFNRLTALGDIDGDGFDDFAQTTFTEGFNPQDDQDQPPPLLETVTYLYYGRSVAFTSEPASQHPDATLLDVGSLETLGDPNGDGYADVVVSGHGLHILPGSPRRWAGKFSVDQRGLLVAGDLISSELRWRDTTFPRSSKLGDLDGDGFDDIRLPGAVSVFDSFHVEGPYEHIFYGRADLLESAVHVANANATFDLRLSGELHAPGDWDVDGYADLLYNRRTWEKEYERAPESTLLLVRGGPTRFSGTYQASLVQDDPSATLGENTSLIVSPGDLDGDGRGDLMGLTIPKSIRGLNEVFVEYGRTFDVPEIR